MNSVLVGNTENLGDFIISIASYSWIRNPCLLDRDTGTHLHLCRRNKHSVFLTGWLTHKPENWPISTPLGLATSVHISDTTRNGVKSSDVFLNHKNIEVLRSISPIGCRDSHTESLLSNSGIDCFYSGCITSTLQFRDPVIKNQSKTRILVIDDKLNYYKLKSEFRNVLHYSHKVPSWFPWRIKFILAFISLEIIKRSDIVISSRLHAIFPAMAFGKKTVLILEDNLDPRFSRLASALNIIKRQDSSNLNAKALFDFAKKPSVNFELMRKRLISDLEQVGLKHNLLTFKNNLRKILK